MDDVEAAKILLLLSQQWCAERPAPCPEACGVCFWGAKPSCPHLPPPKDLRRQTALGVQSPKETAPKNK